MSGTTDRRERLRDRLLELAQAAIEEGGLAAVKARSLAAEAGCAVGAIYNVYPDLDALVLAVNARTLERLDAEMEAAAGAAPDPRESLLALGDAYLRFAVERPRLWRALFEHRMAEGRPTPDWYAERLERVFRHLREPLGRLLPGRPAAEIGEIAHALFAGTHGIVVLGLDGKLDAAGPEVIAARVRFLVRAALAGARGDGATA